MLWQQMLRYGCLKIKASRPHSTKTLLETPYAVLFSDGASKNNPGDSGSGGVIFGFKSKSLFDKTIDDVKNGSPRMSSLDIMKLSFLSSPADPVSQNTADCDLIPVCSYYRYLGRKTSMQAEYCGLLEGLFILSQYGFEEYCAFVDNEVIVRHLNGEYAVRAPHLLPLVDKAHTIMHRLKSSSFMISAPMSPIESIVDEPDLPTNKKSTSRSFIKRKNHPSSDCVFHIPRELNQFADELANRGVSSRARNFHAYSPSAPVLDVAALDLDLRYFFSTEDIGKNFQIIHE